MSATSVPAAAPDAWCRGQSFKFFQKRNSGDETQTRSVKIDCMADGTFKFEEHSSYYDSFDGDTSHTDIFAQGTWRCEQAAGAPGGSRLVLRGQKRQRREDFKHAPDLEDRPVDKKSGFSRSFDQYLLCNSPWTSECVMEVAT